MASWIFTNLCDEQALYALAYIDSISFGIKQSVAA
jgi:hypothetical protein